MRFAAFTFAFGCAVTVSALPVDPGNGEGGDLQAATGFPPGDILSNSRFGSGETSLDTTGPTPSVPSRGSAPTDTASVIGSGGASALGDPVVPTSSAIPTFRPVNDGKFVPFPGTVSPNNENSSAGAPANVISPGLKGPRGSPETAAVAQSDETGFNNSDFNFFARNNGTLLDNSTSGDLNITVHEFGSETGFRRAVAWVLARSLSSRSEDSRRSRNARNVDLDLDLP